MHFEAAGHAVLGAPERIAWATCLAACHVPKFAPLIPVSPLLCPRLWSPQYWEMYNKEKQQMGGGLFG